jgi:hypothetical protein
MWVSDMNVKSLEDLSLDQVGIELLPEERIEATAGLPIPGGPLPHRTDIVDAAAASS